MQFKTLPIFLTLFASTARSNPPATQPAEKPPGDRRDFFVRAIAPELPAMKYELTIDAIDREPGDAAALYMQAMLLMPADFQTIDDHAWELHHAGKSLLHDPAIDDLLKRCKPVFDLVALASRRERCDWNVPFRELGINSMNPELNHLRSLANLLRIQGSLQIDAGRIDAAIVTIRELYALGRNTGDRPLVSSLVGLGIAELGSELVADLSARPDGPNLYWPLANLPNPMKSFRDAMDGEREWEVANMPVLAKGKHGGITAEDWPVFLEEVTAIQTAMNPNAPEKSDTIIQSALLGMAALPDARKFYSQTRHVSPEEAVKIDSGQVLAIYFIEQFQIATDEESKLLCRPLYEAIEQSAKLPAKLKKMGIADSNLAATMMPSLTRVPVTYGRLDRQIAGLTAVQALRAYAADHAGKLPAKLEDVTETPVPVNPMTGRMFDYRVDGETATLSDETSAGSSGKHGYAMVYTIRIQPQ